MAAGCREGWGDTPKGEGTAAPSWCQRDPSRTFQQPDLIHFSPSEDSSPAWRGFGIPSSVTRRKELSLGFKGTLGDSLEQGRFWGSSAPPHG